MTQTDRLALPLLAAGQAQKEITHNEALALLDMTVQLVVESAGLSTPPGSPEPGQCWIVGDGATGDWAGRDGAIAAWTSSGWIFAAAQKGWRAWVLDRSNAMRFEEPAWLDEASRSDGYYVKGERVAGPRQPAIPDPSGGAPADHEARAAIAMILTALRSHGLIET